MKVFKSALSPTHKKVEPVKGKRGMFTVKNAYSGPYEYFREPEPAAAGAEANMAQKRASNRAKGK